MTIRNRLQLTGLVPIMLLFLLSSYFVVTSYLNFLKANNLKLALKNTILLNDTLINVGKERDLSTLYLGSNKKEFKNTLKKQKVQVDKSIQHLKSTLVRKNKYQLPFLPKLLKSSYFFDTLSYEKIVGTLAKLQTIRPLVDTPNVDFKTLMFQHYTTQLTTPLLKHMYNIQNFSLDAEISSLLLTLRQLTMVEEYSGLERGFISYFLLKKQPMSIEDISLWHQLQMKANIFDLSQITNAPLREKLKQMLTTVKTEKQMHTLVVLSEVIKQNTHDGAYKEKSILWFTQQSHKITLYSKMQALVSNQLWQKSTTYLQKNLLMLAIALLLWFLSFILAYVHYKTTREISLKKRKSHSEKKSIQEQTSSTSTQTPITEHRLLLAHASHDIRTPLHGMLGFIKLLKSTQLDKEQTELLSIIDQSSSTLLQTINTHLSNKRFSTDKEGIEQHTFQTQTLFEHTIETYTIMASEKGVNLHFYMDPNIPTSLQSDPIKLSSILTNLISNAIQYTPKEGEVNVEITQISHKKNIHTLRFEVKDTGIGITEKVQKDIFKPFTQGDTHPHTESAEQHSGLGLSIAYQRVKQLGGMLTLESKKDKGSTFSFTLALENPLAVESTTKHFKPYHCGQCIQTDTTFAQYMKNYMDFYHVKVSSFQTLSALKNLNKEKDIQHYWVDCDHCASDILEAIPSMNPSSLILLASLQNREKLKALGIDSNQIIYKPLTLSKIQNILQPIEVPISVVIPEKTTILPHFTQFNARVLIAEDNTINLKLMQRMLETYGITTDSARDGLEALKKRKEHTYDMIFMDIHMPNVDGIESTAFIRQYEQNKELSAMPIVALTANTIAVNKEKFLQDGLNEYIAKPIDTTDLLRILHLFLEEKIIQVSKEKVSKEKISKELNLKIKEKITPPPIPKVSLKKEIPKEETPEPIKTQSTENTESKEKTLELETETEITTEKQILIAKRFLLEEKILVKVLTSLNYPYQLLKKEDSLKDALESYRYDIVFTDTQYINEEIEGYADIIHIITTQESKSKIKKLIEAYRG